MKTYFEWQTPTGFRPRKSTEYLKKALPHALLDAAISSLVLAIIVLLRIFLHPKHESWFAILFPALAGLVVLTFVVIPVSLPIAMLLAIRLVPRGRIKVKVGENKIVFGEGRRGLFRYEDIQSFRIEKEEFKDQAIPVLEMETFDGSSVGLGLSHDVPIDQLVNFLSERILEARKEMRGLFTRRTGARMKLAGFVLAFVSLISLLFHTVLFADVLNAMNLQKGFETSRVERAIEPGSIQPTEHQSKNLEKQHQLSIESLVMSNHILAGMLISGGLFLFGCVLMLWGDNKFLRAKITRLQAYWVDISQNESSTLNQQET
jgi:hypothetical protein